MSDLRGDILERMLAVARRLGGSDRLEEILGIIIDAMRDTLDAERATVFQRDPASGELFATVAHGIAAPGGRRGGEIRLPAGAGIAGECARARLIVNVADAYADDRFDRAIDERTGFRTRSLLAIPLVAHDGEVVGVAQVLNKRRGHFDERDEQLATALAAQAGVALKRGRLIEDRLVRQELEKELELARAIQRSSIPAALPAVRGFEIDAWTEPATRTGGDTFDAVAIGDAGERALLLLADASGHGMGPALLVTQLRSMLRMGARLGADLGSIAAHVNGQLCTDLPEGQFITAWLALVEAGTTTVTGFSAGQAPLLHYVAAGRRVERLGPDAPPLGVLEDAPVAAGPPVPMAPGDVFAVLSDGVFEAAGPDGERFGIERAVSLLSDNAERTPRDIITALRAELDRFAAGRPADDDRTALVIKATR